MVKDLGSNVNSRAVLDHVCEMAPYNTIAKKNRARLDQLAASPGPTKKTKKAKFSDGAPVFIEEIGKSITTVLRRTSGKKAVLHVASSDHVDLSQEKNSVGKNARRPEY